MQEEGIEGCGEPAARRCFCHLSPEDRAVIMCMQRQRCGVREIARTLGRQASTISREMARNADQLFYDATVAGTRAVAHRRQRRRGRKLVPGTRLFDQVIELLTRRWSPRQIEGRLKTMFPDDPEMRASHETIYTAIYALPRGELRKELIACLRQGRSTRRPRSRGTDRRKNQLIDMASIHTRPPEVEDRLVPGHWEGDLIKGAMNRSSIGTLVERSSRLVLLVPLTDATAVTTANAFTTTFCRNVPWVMRKSMTYDQGREMARHKEITAVAGLPIYFADPHSPWQRGTNENTNGLLREYLPKGANLNTFSHEDLADIAYQLNNRPRKCLGFRTPQEVYDDFLVAESKRLAKTTPQGLTETVAIDH